MKRTIIAATILALAGGWQAQATAAQEENTLIAVDHGIMPGGRIVVRATFDQPLRQPPAVFRSYHPRQHIVLDFAATRSGLQDKSRDPDFRGVSAIEVAEGRERTRLTVVLDDPRIHEIEVMGKELWLTLTPLVAVAPGEVSGRFSHMTP